MKSEYFRKQLERDACDLSLTLKRQTNNQSASIFMRNIEFVLSEIKELRTFHKSQLKEILQTECSIGSEYLRLQDLTYKGHSTFPGEKDRLWDRRLSLERERRHLNSAYKDKLSGLQVRLLGLIGKCSESS